MKMHKERKAPVLILSQPQMGENIGSAARVMRNFGFRELRLVSPRDGWPNEKASALAAGAFAKLAPVRVFSTTSAAISDLHMVFAVTARMRDMEKPVFSPLQAMPKLAEVLTNNGRAGLLFGPEASGLENEEIARCDGIITYPVAADFCSLNLAQAVAVAAYAWRAFITQKMPTEPEVRPDENPLASKLEIDNMLEHLQSELSAAGFFFPVEKTTVMMQNLQNLFSRSSLSAQEVRTLRGVIKALSQGRGKKGRS